uniref:Uncharacterized protein n=1 Tax=Bartonella schoenbuchensis (strain DSM 13525 / NCTC 13165 / R1) TaxID=687861 RepID=E6YZ95_BARSR|nr:hypothetical protein B11C_40038 [Bartonella schoenbuchensis R1]
MTKQIFKNIINYSEITTVTMDHFRSRISILIEVIVIGQATNI